MTWSRARACEQRSESTLEDSILLNAEVSEPSDSRLAFLVEADRRRSAGARFRAIGCNGLLGHILAMPQDRLLVELRKVVFDAKPSRFELDVDMLVRTDLWVVF
jgi:hypothetical protein